MKTVRINVGNGYEVNIGNGLLESCGSIAKNVVGTCRAAIVTDSNVGRLYLDKATEALRSEGFEVYSFIFPAGESSKNIRTLSDILDFFAKSGLTRTDCAVALGGGVVGDITGFAAGCYMRGISYIQIPTTLLASVDSSVGGKTAINIESGKNLAGLFIQPAAVICDTACFDTLTPDIFADGIAEAIKTAILGDAEMFEIFESGKAFENIAEITERCVSYKGKTVEADEYENGIRKTLNLGHTPAHAIEKCSEYAITHGHAVAIGTAIMARASAAKGYCSEECAKRIENTLKINGLPTQIDFSAKDLALIAKSDKKRSGESITVVLVREIGNVTLEKINVSELSDLLCSGMEKAL